MSLRRGATHLGVCSGTVEKRIGSNSSDRFALGVHPDMLMAMINKYFAGCCAALLIAATPSVASAQTKDPVAGVWERTSNKDLTTGLSPDEPSRPLRVIYLDGYFIQFMSAAGRAKLDPATRSTWTKEQLADRIRMQGQSVLTRCWATAPFRTTSRCLAIRETRAPSKRLTCALKARR